LSKPWYEDIKDRFNTLDQRELLLQKEVARLSERVHWLLKIYQERSIQETRRETQRAIGKRWKYGIVITATIGTIDLILTLLRMMK